MKKKLIAVFSALVICCAGMATLAGCGSAETEATESAAESSAESTAPLSPNETASSEIDQSETESGETESFEKFFEDNPIDKGYDEQIQSAMTTAEMCDVNRTFADLWETEVKNAFNELKQNAPEDKKAEIAEEEDEWFRTAGERVAEAMKEAGTEGTMGSINRASARRLFYRDEAKKLIERVYNETGSYTFTYRPY